MQSASRLQSFWQREHLWLALQALGFEPSTEAATIGKALTHVIFGVNMFDKPNKDAFYMVFHFLFGKLDSARCKEVFRYCWPPLDKKRDADFRKACCEWLRKISEDAGSGFPQVVASIFLSPGGPKFVNLLYHFARYVMLQHIKKDAEGTHAYITEALQLKNPDTQKALIRNGVARHRYVQILQRENFVISEHQRKAQSLVKQMRDLRSECATLQNQHKMVENTDTDHCKRNEKIQKTRCMWTTIMQTLNMIENEVDVVDSVVKGNVDQYCLDGKDVTMNIPNLLASRVESEMHKLQMEKLYEAGKVNVVTVVQLLNEALKMMKQERWQYDGLKLDLQYLTGKAKFETDILTRLKHMRHKIRREDLVSINKSIADKQREWEKKWTKLLGKCPFNIFKGMNPVLELQPPLSTFSFDPASEDLLKSSVFSQYPPSLPELDLPEREVQANVSDRDHSGSLLRSLMDPSVPNSSGSYAVSPAKQTPLRRRMSLNEKDLRTPLSSLKDRSFLQRSPISSVQKRRSTEIWKRSESFTQPCTPTARKLDPASMARQQLAQQVADYIVSETPRSVGGRGVELDDLIGMISSDPFLSRKEIPRTPENLISEIRTSWRKAIQIEPSPSALAMPVEAPCLDSPAEPDPSHCSQIDLSMACFLSMSHVSDFNDSSDTKKSNAGRTLRHLHHSVTTMPSETSFNIRDGHTSIMEGSVQETLIPSVLDKNTTFALNQESDSKLLESTFHLSLQRQENISAHTTLSWDSMHVAEYNNSSDSHDVIQFGILHETLPGGVGNVSLNSTKSIEPDEGVEEDKIGDDEFSENRVTDWNNTQRKMDLASIRSRYEALKRTFFSESGEDDSLHLSNRRFSKQKSESCISHDTGNMFSPLEKGLSLDLDYLMTPTAKDKKLSLPRLIAFSPNEEIFKEKQVNITDVFEDQGPAKLNKTFDFTPSTTDLQMSEEGQLITL
ncbi:HAUS augmin-like complex subunit 6 [Discoglossus pictus]